jgi:hypothetical protein
LYDLTASQSEKTQASSLVLKFNPSLEVKAETLKRIALEDSMERERRRGSGEKERKG